MRFPACKTARTDVLHHLFISWCKKLTTSRDVYEGKKGKPPMNKMASIGPTMELVAHGHLIPFQRNGAEKKKKKKGKKEGRKM